MPRFLILALFTALSIDSAVALSPYTAQELASVETSNESKIRELRNEEINQIRIALGRRAPSNRMADLYFRLAELYLESYRADFLREGRVHDTRIKNGVSSERLDRSTSMVSLRYGVKSCQELVRLGIPFERMDHVYFFLGYNNKELGNAKDAQKYFKTLLERYPSSPFVYEANKELGDFAFDSAKYREALPYYEKALRLPVKGETEARVKYRLAWTYYRLKQFSRAIEQMKEAISQANSSGDKFISLKEEALRDMALFLTETGNVPEAVTYFQSVLNDRSYYPKVLERLGKEYERNAKPDKAIQVYEAILQTHPESTEAISIVHKLMEVDARQGRFAHALDRLQVLKLTESIPQESELAYSNLKAFVRKTATENHEIYRKKNKKEYLVVSHDYYATYLNFFLKRSDPRLESSEIKMYLADAKRDLGRSDESAALYKQIIQSKDPKYSKQAADLWVGSLTEVLKNEKKSKADLSPVELDFVAAVDFLNENSPDTETAKEASLRVAQLYAGYPQHYEHCVERMTRILEKFPASKQAIVAAKLWLQLKADKKDSEGVTSLIAEFRENKALMQFDAAQTGTPLRLAIAQYTELLRVSRIEKIEKSNDFAKAAAEYEKFAGETKDPKQVEKANSNALIYYERMSDFDSVMRLAIKTKNIPAMKRSALQYFIQGQSEKSARAFAEAGESLAAARVALGAGLSYLYVSQTDQWLRTHPKSPERSRVLLEYGNAMVRLGRKEAQSLFLECAKNKKSQTSRECVQALAALVKRDHSSGSNEWLAKKFNSSEASFELFKLKWRNRKIAPVTLPDAKLKQGVQARIKAIEQQANEAKSLIESGGAVSLGVLEFLGSEIVRYADEIEQADLTLASSGAAKANYKKSLEKVTAPIRGKAKSLAKKAFDKAQELSIYSPDVLNLAQYWVSERTSLWARVQGARPKFRLMGMPPNGGELGLERARAGVRAQLSIEPQVAKHWVDYANLLWGEKKMELAKVAYAQAIELQKSNTAALNNLAVLELSGEAVDDLHSVGQSDLGFKRASETGDGAWIPKWNLAQLMNYYRLFKPALKLIEAVRRSQSNPEVESAYAVSLAGSGLTRESESAMKNAEKLDGNLDSAKYNRFILKAALSQGEDCIDALDKISGSDVISLEQKSVAMLRGACEQH